MRKLKQEFNNISLMKIFEIEVEDKNTGETEYIIFEIELIKNTLFAFHQPLTVKQEKSKNISFRKIVLNKYFSLDQHLQDLNDECINALIESDFFTY